MISKQELVELKKKTGLNLYYLEKEYLQYIFLHAISTYGDSIVFKGGTCLRICYGLERASEDLDFSFTGSVSALKKIIETSLQSFTRLGIEYTNVIQKEFEGNIRFEIQFKGPLYNTANNSVNTLKVDFNKNKVYCKKAKVIKELFSDVPSFVLVVLDEKEILAEKIRAIAHRKQARDLYDLWILLGKGVEIDKTLIKKKLKEELVDLKKISLLSKESYEQDLRNLLTFTPGYDQVVKDIRDFLKSLM
ncbi:MAG: nucleotidyl transferase AbiEii/AbiGii toxin family protein [Candidatus Woesearchaeota archaeon]